MRSLGLALSILLVLCAGARADDPPAPEHKVTQSESYIMLEPMYASIMDGERAGGMLMVAIGLDIPDVQLRAVANRAMPVLRDALVRSLIGFAWTHVRIAEQPDVEALSDRLQRVVDRELRHKGARVLLAQVACRTTK